MNWLRSLLAAIAMHNTTSSNLISDDVVEEIVGSLNTAACSLHGAVDCLLQCYSSASPSNPHFKDLRTRLTTSAFLYRDLHLPRATQLVTNLSNLMCLYDTMDETPFCEQISVLAVEVNRHADYATRVIDIHVRLLQDLNKLHMDVQFTLGWLELDAKKREEKVEHYRQLGEKQSKQEKRDGIVAAAMVAMGVAFCAGPPIVSAICAGAALQVGYEMAEHQSEKYRVLCAAESKEAEMARLAAEIIRDHLTTALKNFIDAVQKIAGFLKKLEGDVSNYAANADRMKENKATMVLYLKAIKSHSSRIQEACGAYLYIMPAVEGRMAALPGFEAADPNYVRRWLTEKFPPRFSKLLR